MKQGNKIYVYEKGTRANTTMHSDNYRQIFILIIGLIAQLQTTVSAQEEQGKTAKGGIAYYEGNGQDKKMWKIFYPHDFYTNRVRAYTYPMDSLPDDITLKLVNDSSEFCFPMRNIITSPYGWRQKWNRPHRGVDILLKTGDPVRSCFGGVVRVAGTMGGYGNCIVVRHENGLETVYGHLSKVLVKPRQIVKAGDIIGLGGSTGHSTGPHLHFEVRFQYEPFDPEWILDFKSYKLRTRRLHLDKTYFGITPPQGNKKPSFKADKSIVSERVANQNREIYHQVKKNETMEILAIQYRTTVSRIKELNPEVRKLKEGDRIRVR